MHLFVVRHHAMLARLFKHIFPRCMRQRVEAESPIGSNQSDHAFGQWPSGGSVSDGFQLNSCPTVSSELLRQAVSDPSGSRPSSSQAQSTSTVAKGKTQCSPLHDLDRINTSLQPRFALFFRLLASLFCKRFTTSLSKQPLGVRTKSGRPVQTSFHS